MTSAEARAACEKARILGIKEAARFVQKIHGEDTLAEEILLWVIPHGYKVQSALDKLLLEERYGKSR